MKTQKKEELKYKLENIIEYKTDKISKDKVKVKISYLIRNRMENLNTRLHECGSNINHIKIIEGIEFRDRETDKITRNKYDLIFMNDYKHSFTSSAGFKDTITGDCFTMDMFMNIEDLFNTGRMIMFKHIMIPEVEDLDKLILYYYTVIDNVEYLILNKDSIDLHYIDTSHKRITFVADNEIEKILTELKINFIKK